MNARTLKWMVPCLMVTVAVLMLILAPLPTTGAALAQGPTGRGGGGNTPFGGGFQLPVSGLLAHGQEAAPPAATAVPTAVPPAAPTAVPTPAGVVQPTTGAPLAFDPNIVLSLLMGLGAIGWGLRMRKG